MEWYEKDGEGERERKEKERKREKKEEREKKKQEIKGERASFLVWPIIFPSGRNDTTGTAMVR